MKEIPLTKQNRDQVEREAAILGKLSHKNIISLHDFHKEQYEAFLVMELGQRSLHDYLRAACFPISPLVVGL
jgi:serine/threonine protein kinase